MMRRLLYKRRLRKWALAHPHEAIVLLHHAARLDREIYRIQKRLRRR